MADDEVVVLVEKSCMRHYGTEFAWLSDGAAKGQLHYFSTAPDDDDFGLGFPDWRKYIFDDAVVPCGFIFDGKHYNTVKEADDAPLCHGDKRYLRIKRLLQERYNADLKFRLIVAAIKKTGKTLLYFEGRLPRLGDEMFFDTWGVYLRGAMLMDLVK